MSLEEKKQEGKHTEEYFDQLGFDVKKLLKKKLANIVKKAAPPFEIPDVVEGLPEAGIPEAPEIEDVEAVTEELEDLKDTLEDAALETRINEIKEEFSSELESIVNELKSELQEFKDRKVPETGGIDSGGVYKEKVYEAATYVLDKILIDLFEDIPDYSLIANQVSRTFDDGTVSDGIIVVGVTVPNSGYRYDFKIDVPILNGIIQYPTYLQRGQKIIPLTRDKIQEELNSMAFRKIEVESPYERSNIFNNIGDNIHKRPSNQKWYDVENTEPRPVGMPPKSKYPAHKTKEDKNE